MKPKYRVKFNYRPRNADNSLGKLSEYEFYDCDDMAYEEAIELENYHKIQDSLIYDLEHGSKEDYRLEEFYIIRA